MYPILADNLGAAVSTESFLQWIPYYQSTKIQKWGFVPFKDVDNNWG